MASAGTNKRVELRLREPVSRDAVADIGEVIEYRPDRVVIEVERHRTGEAVNRALQSPVVENVNLTDLPLEDSLAHIYGSAEV